MATASNNLMSEFCKSIGMEGIGLDDNNQRSLSFDEKLVVTFLGGEDDVITALSFIADCGDNPKIIARLMEQNFLAEAHGGARFALEPNTTRVILTRSWNAIKTTVPEFSAELEKMVNSGMFAQEFIEKGGEMPAQNKPAPVEGATVVDSLSQAYQSI